MTDPLVHNPSLLTRIAMVAYTHYQTDPRCRREATLAAEAGWDVHFYSLSQDGSARTSQIEGITLHELPMPRYRGGSSATYVLSYLRFLLLASWEVQKHHLKSRFAVVHVNTMPDFMVVTALLPRLFGAKVILDVHDVMPEIYMTKFQVPATHWKIRLIKFMEVMSARAAHKVLTAEHPKKELLKEHGIPAAKIQVLLNLPDDKLFVPQFTLTDPTLATAKQDPECEFRLIYHGTITHRLGLDFAVGALNILRDELPGARLQLFGDGDQLSDLHEQAQQFGLNDRIWFSNGFVPIEQVIPSIKEAHLAVIPTRHEISTDYMLPTKLLEYLAFGIPAVFTPTKTVRHYFGDDHPLYINDPTPQETANKIRWVRENYAEAKKLTAELQDSWFSRFQWAEHKAVYLTLLENLKSFDSHQGK
ncbi:glycosyltransferase [Methylobacter svalbardensis]|uniref:glycosyltransferase n=1 Tax=Methylobacter svalbardensis TaxID=3080016 RepID=UPI0030ED3BE0